ncbi:hypothetical protein EPO15_02960 [bacterium]|nr:MAG: hypothetical protein EPO15_02960 [bacterium]
MNEGRYKILSFKRAHAPALAMAAALAALALAPALLLGQPAPVPAEVAAALKGLRGAPAERNAAMEALVKAGAPALRPVLEGASSDRQLRAAAVVASRIGRPAVPELLALLDDAAVGGRAGDVLAQVSTPDFVGFLPELLACTLERPQARQSCGQALVRAAGPKGKRAVPALAKALAEGDPDARPFAALALGQVGAKAGVPALAAALGDPAAPVRAAAATALGRIGRSAASALPALRRAAAEDANEAVRRAAQAAAEGVRG